MKRRRERILPHSPPSAAITADFRKRLDRLILRMHRSYMHFLKAQYRATPPRMLIAMDSPADDLQRELNELGRRWERQFYSAADPMARYFAGSVRRRSRQRMASILSDADISIPFNITPVMRDVVQATIRETVSLIKSIQSEYHTQVEGLVMRSVTAGRDLAGLTKELETRYGVSRRKAATIALNQNNNATTSMHRAAQLDVGIEEGIWMHSHAGKVPRPTHKAQDGKRFSIRDGWHDPDPKVAKRIWPGQLINCFPASTEIDFAYDVEKAYRHWFRGDLTEIITEQGKTLRATPNHPILTPLGWRPIGLLDEGDEVIQLCLNRADIAKIKFYENQRVPLISEIFASCDMLNARRLEIALGDEFHGDIIANCDIDIVDTARPLSFGLNPSFSESHFNRRFAMSSSSASFIRFIDHLLERGFCSSSRLISRFGEELASFSPFVLHSYLIGRTAIPNLTSDFFDTRGNRMSRLRVFNREIENASPAFVLPTQVGRIVKRRQFGFRGHVFNLQTKSGYYSAGGIIVHNCRCTWRPVVKGFS